MLANIDLTRTVAKEDFKKAKPELEIKLVTLQRQAIQLKVPILLLFEGWDASGKGSLINDLILPLDPRGFKVHSIPRPTEDEILRPFLWRFWVRTPAQGRIAIFDRGWYWPVWTERVNKDMSRTALERTTHDISSFERQLVDGGTVIIKFLLHISKKEQKRRFKKLLKTKATAWRVTKDDLKRHKQYEKYLNVMEQSLAQTDTNYAPWTIIEAHDRRFALLKMYHTVIHRLEEHFKNIEQRKASPATATRIVTTPASLIPSILDKVDLSLAVERDTYRKELEEGQDRIRELEHEMYVKRVPAVLAYEGWDAAGKGGTLRRLVQRMDPRGYEVVPVAAPSDEEKAHHYLWRFWRQMPKAGHMAIFDRSWYGRVLVERVEGFCSEIEWRRAFSEINEMEEHMANFGTVILKFWLHIDQNEQLRRFKEREKIEYKRWKITEEDWRNRKKWDVYMEAVNEMIYRTSTPYAPWVIVESNNKQYARLKVVRTVVKALEKALKK